MGLPVWHNEDEHRSARTARQGDQQALPPLPLLNPARAGSPQRQQQGTSVGTRSAAPMVRRTLPQIIQSQSHQPPSSISQYLLGDVHIAGSNLHLRGPGGWIGPIMLNLNLYTRIGADGSTARLTASNREPSPGVRTQGNVHIQLYTTSSTHILWYRGSAYWWPTPPIDITYFVGRLRVPE